jgi:flavin reductase (DIM6/NTAB) family NADH-FMN oxidoreductase RutF
VSVCIQNTSSTWPRLRARPRLGVSVLSEGQDDICVRLSSKEGDRFAGVGWEAGPGDSVFIHDSSAWLDCSLHEEVQAGDHTIALLRIRGLRAAPSTPPLIFHGSRFRKMAAV